MVSRKMVVEMGISHGHFQKMGIFYGHFQEIWVYSNSSMMKYGNLIWNLMGYKTKCQWLENSFTYR